MKRMLIAGVLLIAAGAVHAQDATPEALPPALITQMEGLENYTEAVRGLQLEGIERGFPSRESVRAYLQEVYARELPPETLDRQQALYVALGLLPADIDLRAVYIDLLGSQVAGFYDSETAIMNVVTATGEAGDSLSFTEQIIYVHEYTHALQDAAFDLDAALDGLTDQPDASLAALSLVEGDATATMNLYTQTVMAQNPMAAFGLLVEGLQAGNLTLPPGVPDILARELLLPYEDGFNFVLALYADGGWAAIDAAFGDVPTTTEQILHPEKYLQREIGQAVTISGAADVLGADWTPLWDVSLGEFYLREHLRLGVSGNTARQAAAGWGGDRFQLYQNADGATAWILATAWDTSDDAQEFVDAYRAAVYARSDTPSDADDCWILEASAAWCVIDGADGLIAAYAPDRATALALLTTQEQE